MAVVTAPRDCRCACCKERGCHCPDYPAGEWCDCELCVKMLYEVVEALDRGREI